MLPVRERPRHDRVGDRRSAPMREEHVEAVELRQVVAARLPARREVRLGAVVEVAHVVEREPIAVEFRARQLGDVGLPVGVLPRLQRQIPEQHREEDRRHERESAWERTEHPEAEHARDDRHARQDLPQQWRPRDRVREHQRAPAERDERDQTGAMRERSRASLRARRDAPERTLDLFERSARRAGCEAVADHRDQIRTHIRIRGEVAVPEEAGRPLHLDEVDEVRETPRPSRPAPW